MRNTIFVILLLSATPLYAGMYKWVDENGVTHYSATPPAGQQAERMRAPPPPPVDPEAEMQKLRDKEQAMEDRRDVEKLRQEEQAQKQAEQEQRKKRCANARKNLETLGLGGNRRIVLPDGQVIHPTDEQREAQTAEARKQIEESCD